MDLTVRDAMAFHRIDRAAYERLLSLGVGHRAARDAVALLLWMYRAVGIDSSASVCLLVRTPADAARLVSDARAVIAVLHRSAWPQCNETPAPSMCGGGGQAAAVTFDASRLPGDVDGGVADVLGGGVGKLVFDDRLHALLRRYEEGGGSGPLPPELAAPYRRRSHAPPSMRFRTPEEVDPAAAAAVRSLFVTFSKGSPLTLEEIDEYFTERWGKDCVERVMVERRATAGDEAPTYGRVVFRRAEAAEAVLAGKRLVKLLVNGRHLWARKYVPRDYSSF